jgi:hypothetical protein
VDWLEAKTSDYERIAPLLGKSPMLAIVCFVMTPCRRIYNTAGDTAAHEPGVAVIPFKDSACQRLATKASLCC